VDSCLQPSREVGEQLPLLIAINDELLAELLADTTELNA